jgi:hypothetical protein
VGIYSLFGFGLVKETIQEGAGIGGTSSSRLSTTVLFEFLLFGVLAAFLLLVFTRLFIFEVYSSKRCHPLLRQRLSGTTSVGSW